METKKQLTAVEWLFYRMIMDKTLSEKADFMHEAKEMEKEQMLNAFQESRLTHPMIGFKHETFVDYYNKTFKSE